MTDAERLTSVKKYVEEMAPVFWASILESPEREGYKHGYSMAMYEAQQDLLGLLNDD